MNWEVTVEKGEEVHTQGGTADDPYWRAAMDAKNADAPVARISFTATHGIEYGEIKGSCTVSIDCVQSKQHMDNAALLACRAATEYVNAALGYYVPQLPPLKSP